MALVLVLAFTALGIFQAPLDVRDETKVDAYQRMQQRAEQLRQEWKQLLEEIEQIPQEPSRLGGGVLHFRTLEEWQLWVCAGGLLLLFCWLFCWLWKRICEPGSSSKCGCSRGLEEEKEEEDPLEEDRFLNECVWPLPNRRRACTMVEELVNDLLCICRRLSGNSFVPRLQDAIGVGGFIEGEDLVYRLIVPLKPPPGHIFHIELGTKGDRLLRNSRLRVELECMCIREQGRGDVLCFLHHSEDELMSSQEASLLEILCTGSYLDVQKTAFWLQHLMTAASFAVLQATTCNIMVLPSTRFCKLKMIDTLEKSLYIELILAVEEGNSETFVTME